MHGRTQEQTWDFRAISPKFLKPFARCSRKSRVRGGHQRGLSKIQKEVFDLMLSKAARNSQTSKIADFAPGAKKVRQPHWPPYLSHSNQNFTRTCRSIVLPLPHNVPQLELPLPFWGHKPPVNWKRLAICDARYCQITRALVYTEVAWAPRTKRQR